MKTKLRGTMPNWLAFLGGFFWITFWLYYIFSGIDYRELGAIVLIAALGTLFMALAVFSLMQGQHLGTSGKATAGFLLFGKALFVLGAFLSGTAIWPGGWLIAIGGEMLTTLGLIAFGLGLLADQPRPLWKWIPLIMVPFYFLSWASDPGGRPTWVSPNVENWLAVIYGLGWILLGFLLPGNDDVENELKSAEDEQ